MDGVGLVNQCTDGISSVASYGADICQSICTALPNVTFELPTISLPDLSWIDLSFLNVMDGGPIQEFTESLGLAICDLFTAQIEIIRDVAVNPFDVIIGGAFVISVLVYIKAFIDTFRNRDPIVGHTLVPIDRSWDKANIRTISLVSATGAIARFIDFGITRSWFVVNSLATSILRGYGGATGVLRYSDQAIKCMEDLAEIDRLTKYSNIRGIYDKKIFESYWYSRFMGAVGNLSFALYSGLQIGSLVTGTVLSIEFSGLILTIGVVGLFASGFFRFMDHSSAERDLLRLLDGSQATNQMHEMTLVRYLV